MNNRSKAVVIEILSRNFRPTELAVPILAPEAGSDSRRDDQATQRRFEDALANCAASDIDVWSFEPWGDKISRGLAPAYQLFVEVVRLGAPALTAVMAQTFFAGRKRKPQAGNPALLTVMLALKPKNQRDRKRCSDYANVLICFARREVDPDEFACEMKKTTLAQCIASVRNDGTINDIGADDGSERGSADDTSRMMAERDDRDAIVCSPDLDSPTIPTDSTIVAASHGAEDAALASDATGLGIELRLVGGPTIPPIWMPIENSVQASTAMNIFTAWRHQHRSSAEILQQLAAAFADDGRDEPRPS